MYCTRRYVLPRYGIFDKNLRHDAKYDVPDVSKDGGVDPAKYGEPSNSGKGGAGESKHGLVPHDHEV